MEESERIVREVLKLLPEIAKALSQTVPAHPGRQDVSIAQVKALVHLAEYGPQTMSELAAGLQVTTPSATGLVNPLVKTGYVVRQRESDDRRLVTVRLSETARVFADRILAVRRAQVENALAGMDVDARAHFLEGLSRLAQECREEERS